MGVYIKEMEMPKSCIDCDVYIAHDYCDHFSQFGVGAKTDGVYPDCPLIEIVRCRECKKHGKNSCPMTFTFSVITDDNNYCSYAERRADENALGAGQRME